ncbi:MAG: hypothetical protein WAV20_04315, partial [Blastocatellia bacterium]
MKLKIFTMFSVAVFVVGLAVTMSGGGKQKPAALTARESSRFVREALPPRAFTATQIESYTDAKGNDTVRHIRYCEVKEDGSWSEVWKSVGRDGEKVLTGNPVTGHHTFSNGRDSMVLPTKAADGGAFEPALYRNREYLSRRAKSTEKIAGLEAFVVRSDISDRPGLWIETAHAPETGPFNLR